jgi:pyruvate formate lyase activating enzyme
MTITGRVFDIQRFSIHDGPGIRTTVFYKGCPLRCLWCHNPEGISRGFHLSFFPDRCIGCGFCFTTCPNEAHQMVDGRHVIERDRCEVCGACTVECYSGALELVGRDTTVEAVLAEVMRDEPFYETSHGGMTLSGGEPMLQIAFTEALLRAAHENGLHCCMETCGYAPLAHYERILPYVDLFLYDIKETDRERHIAYTGVPPDLIFSNLRALHDWGAEISLRLPIIPGYNDRPDHFRAVAALARSHPRLRSVEIMPYHPLGTGKVERMGLSRDGREQSDPPSKETVSCWIDEFETFGVCLANER